MEWKNPEAFFMLLPLMGLLIWTRIRKRRSRPSVQFSDVRIFKRINGGIKSYLAPLPFWLKVIAIVGFIIALARPQEVSNRIKRNVEGVDIIVALDVSDSMLIEDMQPENRLEAAKKVIKEFIEERVSDRIGLVVFSGESYTRIPPTLDYDMLLKSLKDVQTSRTVKMGTAIGVALANSVSRLKDSRAKTRIVILLTDGENNSGTIAPETALDIAKGYGIRVYTIGMGVDGQAQLPIYYTDAFGNKKKRYQPIHSKVNDELLGRLADETGGKYYRATNSSALKNVFNDINKLEKTEIEVTQYTKYDEKYMNYLLAGIFAFFCAIAADKILLRRFP